MLANTPVVVNVLNWASKESTSERNVVMFEFVMLIELIEENDILEIY